jgi:toxin ParE1/3/4
LRVYFHPLARLETDEAEAWYHEIDPDFAEAFLDELEEYVSIISRNPDLYRLRAHGVRRVNLSTYPYHLIYRTRESELQILAVAHDSRRPNYWIHRTSL